MPMRSFVVSLVLLGGLRGPVLAQSSSADALRAALERYNQAFIGKDAATVRGLLANDVVLYEHSVRNVGVEDVWTNHLGPELQELEGLRLEFSDLRLWASDSAAIVTRQYTIRATMKGRPIDAKGNETMGWVYRDGGWKIAHLHYSHACPRAAAGAGTGT